MGTFYIVTIRRDGVFSEIEYIPVKAASAQEAVDEVREKTACYEAVDVYKMVKNWM